MKVREENGTTPASRNILIIGAAGSIGSHFCERLYKHKKNKVIPVAHTESGRERFLQTVGKQVSPDDVLMVDVIKKTSLDQLAVAVLGTKGVPDFVVFSVGHYSFGGMQAIMNKPPKEPSGLEFLTWKRLFFIGFKNVFDTFNDPKTAFIVIGDAITIMLKPRVKLPPFWNNVKAYCSAHIVLDGYIEDARMTRTVHLEKPGAVRDTPFYQTKLGELAKEHGITRADVTDVFMELLHWPAGSVSKTEIILPTPVPPTTIK